MASAIIAQHAGRHGGRLAEAVAAWPDAPRPWLDLSTGISPWAWPGARAQAQALRRLPDPEDLAALEQAAAAAFGVADPGRVLATAGTQAAIALLTGALAATRVAISGPTYGGHAEAWRAAGAAIETVGLALDALQLCDADILVAVNPNNPCGRALAPGPLAALAARRDAQGLWTIVDEAFVEAAPALSLAGQALERLIVLRSFGKFYGLPGVRLGFVIADPRLTAQLRARQGDWPVSADALALGTGAYRDHAWADRQRRRLADAAQRLDGLLAASGFEVLGGTALARLARRADARQVFERLCAQGVLTRPFDHDGELLRFGLPRDGGRLAAALEAVR